MTTVEIRERPILMSTPMVRAVLDGRKSQTRRVIKPQPEWNGEVWAYDGLSFISDEQMADHLFHEVYGANGTPYGSVWGDDQGDGLWVRETTEDGWRYVVMPLSRDR